MKYLLLLVIFTASISIQAKMPTNTYYYPLEFVGEKWLPFSQEQLQIFKLKGVEKVTKYSSSQETEYCFNKKGELILETFSTLPGNVVEYQIAYDYDDKGRIIGRKKYENNEIDFDSVSYDEKGRYSFYSSGFILNIATDSVQQYSSRYLQSYADENYLILTNGENRFIINNENWVTKADRTKYRDSLSIVNISPYHKMYIYWFKGIQDTVYIKGVEINIENGLITLKNSLGKYPNNNVQYTYVYKGKMLKEKSSNYYNGKRKDYFTYDNGLISISWSTQNNEYRGMESYSYVFYGDEVYE